MNVCYYVSGHGFGHATRAAEIINELIALYVTVHIVTLVPEVIWIASGVFRSELCTFRRPSQPLDCGPLQTSPLDIEEEQSLMAYTEMMVHRDTLVAEEVEYIRLVQARLVISDISPLACAAAHKAKVPSCVCGNFSWVEIFSPFLITPEFALYQPLLDAISADYRKATFLLRMPGFMPMPCFSDIVDVPLVVRMAHRSRAEVRESLGLAEKTKVLLFCFGGYTAHTI
jgi:L-arabinokinase